MDPKRRFLNQPPWESFCCQVYLQFSRHLLFNLPKMMIPPDGAETGEQLS
jgi:hypothetical protein